MIWLATLSNGETSSKVPWLYIRNSCYNLLFFLSHATNMYFDCTAQASRVLKMERYSLQHLLQHFCGVTANKEYAVFIYLFLFTPVVFPLKIEDLSLHAKVYKSNPCRYQNADWRARPLPDVMIKCVCVLSLPCYNWSVVDFLFW